METRLRRSPLAMYMLFKSYYVVWKPSSSSDTGGSTIWFKSYYVVWKLIASKPSQMWKSSLNRTM